jgi:uroporphyrinogen decarboxylase
MAKMTKRERVMRTVGFEETDRVPLYDIFQNDAVIEHYAGRKLDYDDAHTVGVAVGRALDMTRMVTSPHRSKVIRHEDGHVIRQERWTSWVVERPFHDAPPLIEWIKKRIDELNAVRYARSHTEDMHRMIEERWAWFAEGDPDGDPAVLVIESGAGLTDLYHTAGMDLFTQLLFEEPELVDEWLEAVNRAEVRRVEAIADPRWIPIALTYDDIAFKNGPLFSPDWLRAHWAPCLKRLVDAWHARGVLCCFHSDGNLWLVLDDLVAAGIDGLNPLEVLAGMEVAEVRKRYPKLFLTGGIDVSQLLTNGTPDEVRATCEQAIRDTGGRGYFMGSSTELHWDVRLENAMAMFETAWNFTWPPSGV